MPAAAPLVARPSGILAPTSPLTRRTRVMARAKFLRLLRHMEFSRKQAGLLTRFACETCKAPVQLQRGDSALVQTDSAQNRINVKTDRFSLACGCTVWTVRG